MPRVGYATLLSSLSNPNKGICDIMFICSSGSLQVIYKLQLLLRVPIGESFEVLGAANGSFDLSLSALRGALEEANLTYH